MLLGVLNLNKVAQGQIPRLQGNSVRLAKEFPLQRNLILLWCLMDHRDLHTLYLLTIPAPSFRTSTCWGFVLWRGCFCLMKIAI
jgi:hypothetical protein